jgi:DNA-binding IclR family transcriptional regulator
VDEVHRLCEQIGESVGIHLLDHHEMICLAFAEAQQPVRVTFWIGERSPVHLTSTGIAALSTMEPEQWRPLLQASLKAYPNLPARNEEEMESILAASARKGFAVADESYERGVRAVAVPVFDAQGAFACTICIAAPSQRVTMRKLELCVPDLRDAAQRVSRSMMARGNASIVQRLGASSIVSSR